MGLLTKIWAIPAVLAAAAHICTPAFASTTGGSRTPTSQAVKPLYGHNAALKCSQKDAANQPECMSQSDAFSTAGEQAAFLGVYQMSFGPYGQIQDPKKRDKMLRETAAAIEDCINGQNCDDDKQKKVLKALVQYNLGQDIKMMMLTNNTNRDKMVSLDNSKDAQPKAHNAGVLSQADIRSALASGKDYSVDNSDPIKAYQTTGKVVAINRNLGSTKAPVYQLEESRVDRQMHPDFLREREILGDKFLKEYGVFLDKFATTNAEHESRFYKYVPAKNDSVFHVYDETRDGIAVNRERFQEIQAEQNNKNIREALNSYKKDMKPMQGYMGDDGNVYITTAGSGPKDIGIGEMVEIDPANYPGVNFNDLMQDGKITKGNQGRAVARVVNKIFENEALEQKQKEDAARAPASADKNPNRILNLALSPATFDQFLDEIWPSSVDRKKRLSAAPPANASGTPPTAAQP